MHNDHLGWILTCPSNLGTGLRAGAMVQVPLFSGRKDFKEVCAKMGLQARGTGGVDTASTGKCILKILISLKNFDIRTTKNIKRLKMCCSLKFRII
jgi:protein-arginine kinase